MFETEKEDNRYREIAEKVEFETRNTFDNEEITVDMHNLKATHMPENTMTNLPKPITKNLDTELMTRFNKMKEVFKDIKGLCNFNHNVEN